MIQDGLTMWMEALKILKIVVKNFAQQRKKK